MRVTVCQLGETPASLVVDWQGLVSHVQHEKPHLVLLPELPFHPWFAWRPAFDPAVWDAALAAHAA